MAYDRMLNQDQPPSEEEILATIGEAKAWQDLRDYLAQAYDFEPELVFYGKKYGWTIRYRKSGKTLCSLFPEHGAFTVLVVLGKHEATKAIDFLHELSPGVQEVIGGTKQLRDGRWLWVRVHQPGHVHDVMRLLATKRKPLAKPA